MDAVIRLAKLADIDAIFKIRTSVRENHLSQDQLTEICSGLMKPDTHLGENARQIEVSDDQTTPLLYS